MKIERRESRMGGVGWGAAAPGGVPGGGEREVLPGCGNRMLELDRRCLAQITYKNARYIPVGVGTRSAPASRWIPPASVYVRRFASASPARRKEAAREASFINRYGPRPEHKLRDKPGIERPRNKREGKKRNESSRK